MEKVIRLFNKKDEAIVYNVTRVPLSNPLKSPSPNLIPNPENPEQKIPNPSLFTNTDQIVIPGKQAVEFSGGTEKSFNVEQAEYLYIQLGTAEQGGAAWADGPIVTNSNFLIEVDKDGKELRGAGSLFAKHRSRTGPEIAANKPMVEVEVEAAK